MNICNINFWYHVGIAVLKLVIGIPSALWFSRFIFRKLQNHARNHVALLIYNVIFYGSLSLITISILQDLGLTSLLGAAGIIGIATGFAAQTGLSNIISGIFLLIEDVFEINDTIMFGDKITGKVESIDLFSVKLRTIDNKLVRIPNEALLKNPVINLTYFPKRRLDLKITVKNNYEFSSIIKLLKKVIDTTGYYLETPEPSFKVIEAHANTIHILLEVWTHQEKLEEACHQLILDIQQEATLHRIILEIVPLNVPLSEAKK